MSGRKLAYGLYHLLWLGVDLLLPPTCAGCGASGARWCDHCQGRVLEPPPPLCEVCGSTSSSSGGLCADCTVARPRYRQLRSWSLFQSPVRPALHRLKYRRDLGLGEALTPELLRFVSGLRWQVDLLVPVPLGSGRLKERGYNQAELIGWPLSLALDIAYSPQAVYRTRETLSQVGLSRAARRDNVRDAFRAKPELAKGRAVLLVDDVATTGATLSSCAEALYAAGARDVFALTVSRARRSASLEGDAGASQDDFSAHE